MAQEGSWFVSCNFLHVPFYPAVRVECHCLIDSWLAEISFMCCMVHRGPHSHPLYGPLGIGWDANNNFRPFSSQRGASLAVQCHLGKWVMLVFWPNTVSHNPFSNFFRVTILHSVNMANFPPNSLKSLRFGWTYITVSPHVYFTSVHMETFSSWQSSLRFINLFWDFLYVITLAA